MINIIKKKKTLSNINTIFDLVIQTIINKFMYYYYKVVYKKS